MPDLHTPAAAQSALSQPPTSVKDFVDPRRPTLSIGLIVRNCAKDLERCLSSVRARPWGKEVEIVVCDTMSSDDGKTLAVAWKYADKVFQYAGPDGNWTPEMYAFDDAAAARNEAFKHCTGRWVMWLDADDELLGPDETSRLLELNGRLRPGVGSSDKKFGGDPNKAIGLTDMLRMIDLHPDGKRITGFWAPYLYRFVENDFAKGVAQTWQIRERIVRNDGSWSWVRPAHEVLVPKDPRAHMSMGDLTSLLIVHRKVWDEQAALYSLTRHRAILQAGYEAGTRNVQDVLYLENYAWALNEPIARRRELIAAGIDCAHTAVDKARMLARRANLAVENAYFHDAISDYAGAIEICPEIGDFYFALAGVYEKAEWWPKAVEWYERGVKVLPAHPFSDVTPRDHLVLMRIRGALCAHRATKAALAVNNLDAAEQYASRAFDLARAALAEPCIGPDKMEAIQWGGLFENELNALKVAKQIFAVWDYLKKNDETQKARELLDSVPHNLKDHPIIVEIEKWARQLDTHFDDSAAYAEFYEAIGTDVQSDADDQTRMALPRGIFAAEQLKKEHERLGRPLRILEVGPFDGITLLPLMRELPDCTFVGLEIKKDAADRLTQRIAKLGWAARAEIVHGQLADLPRFMFNDNFPAMASKFDAVIFFEVIEHVPDVQNAIDILTDAVQDGGQLFISTPWGAFDRGHQPMADTRDSRGHVRAMMPDELIHAVEASGLLIVEEQAGSHGEGNYGDTLHLVARKLDEAEADQRAKQIDVQFAVAAALWDWHASYLLKTGMGASEETIVFLARELAKDASVKARVFGPIPKAYSLYDEEVNSRVQYSPRESVRQLNPAMPLVVSRAPSYLKVLEEKVGEKFTEATLWLQDAYYPDLKEHQSGYKNIVVLSRWHREQMEQCGVPADRMTVIPNFLLPEHFDVARVEKANEDRAKALAAGEARFIYASSPDRGLLELLSVWKYVLKEWPKAQLRIFYGWEGCMKLGVGSPEWAARYRDLREEYLKLKDQPGVIEHGRVPHNEIADWMRWAHVFPYVTSFGETWCSNAMKARAAGLVPVVSPVAALNESAACDQTVWVNYLRSGEASSDFMWRYFEGIKRGMGTTDEARISMAKRAIDEYEIAAILPFWKKLLGV